MAHNHCHDEHHDHGGGHVHDHSEDITPALQNHLYEQIDFSSVRALNEQASGSGRKVLQKTWAQRLVVEPEIESDADEQIMLHVPFTGQVRLHSLHVRSSATSSAPRTLQIHINNEDLDFNTISEAKPTQTVELSLTSEVQEIPVKRALFNQTRHLCLFFEDNHSYGEEDVTRFSYLGFKGDFMKLSREPVEVMYEAAARPSDHKVQGASIENVGTGFGSGSGPKSGF